jgi:hypothetical protein
MNPIPAGFQYMADGSSDKPRKAPAMEVAREPTPVRAKPPAKRFPASSTRHIRTDRLRILIIIQLLLNDEYCGFYTTTMSFIQVRGFVKVFLPDLLNLVHCDKDVDE